MLRRAASRLAYRTLVGVGTTHVFRHWNRAKLPILAYHGLHAGDIDPLVNFDGMYLHADRFERQMRYLARHYSVVPLERSHDAVTSVRRVAVTFDDGYASIYRYAYPVLKALGLPATVFVSTDFVARRTMMWWDRLRLAIRARRETPDVTRATLDRLHARLRPLAATERDRMLGELDGGGPRSADGSPYDALTLEQMAEMAAGGISFQSHGVTHTSFRALSTEQIAAELRDSKALLERWCGRPVTWFAYPFGESDPRAAALLTHTGYDGAVHCREMLNRPGDAPFEIPRIGVGDPISLPQFIAAVSGLRAATGHLKRALRGEPVA